MDTFNPKQKVLEAILRVTPKIRGVLESPKALWGPGPEWLVIAVKISTCGAVISVPLGTPGEWNLGWGVQPDFRSVAIRLAKLAFRARMSTRQVVAEFPTYLRSGDFILPGGLFDRGIAVAVYGAKDHINERIAQIVLDEILYVFQDAVRAYQEAGAILIAF